MKPAWRRLLPQQLVEQGPVVVRIDITVGRKLVRARQISIDIAGIDDRKRNLDRLWNILAFKGLYGCIDGECTKPVGLHGRPGFQAFFLPEFQKLTGIFTRYRHRIAPLAVKGENCASRDCAA